MRINTRGKSRLWLTGSLLFALILSGCTLFPKAPEVNIDPEMSLQDLRLSVGKLSPDFKPKTFSYTASVADTEPSVTVRPVSSNAGAIISVSINGDDPAVVGGGKDSPPLNLEIGDNVIIVHVADGEDEQTYRISIKKEAVVLQDGAGGYVGTADTQLAQAVNYQGNNLGGQHKFEVGYSGPWFRDQKYALIRFDELPIPSEATVTEATLNLWYYADRSGLEILHPNKEVYVHQVLVPWEEGRGGDDTSNDGSPAESGEVTWASFMAEQTPFDDEVIDSVEVKTDPAWYTFTLTDLANGWITEATPNYGVLLKIFTYPANDDDRMTGTKQFRSREHTVVEERPYLSVVYTMPLEGLKLDRDTLDLKKDQSPVTVTAFPRPLNAVYEQVEWSSSDTKVVTVADGVITPVGKGEAVVQATISDGAASYTAEINVTVE